MADLTRIPVSEPIRQRFITEIREAFRKSHEKEYGLRKHPILPVENIEKSFGAREYRNILRRLRYRSGNRTQSLSGKRHKNGIPKSGIRETQSPCYEKRNIHFYPNKCGFHLVKSCQCGHKAPHRQGEKAGGLPTKTGKNFFRFEKTTNKPAPPTSPASKWRFPDIPPFLPAGTETDIPLPARTCMKKRCDSSTRPAGRPSSRQNPVSRIPPTPAGHSFPEIPHNAETHGNRVRPKRTNPARQPGCRLQPAFSGKERHHVSRQ